MTRQQDGATRPAILATILIIAIAAAITDSLLHKKPALAPIASTQNPMTRPTTQVASAQTEPVRIQPAEPTPQGYLDVIRDNYPKYPATQPLAFPLDLGQAAHFVVREPVYLSSSPRADLWIMRDNAPPTEQVLKEAMDSEKDVQVHLMRDCVVFVHWLPADSGPWLPCLICKTSDDRFEAITTKGRQALPRNDYRWDRAMSWNEKLVVPCASGVSILTLEPSVRELYHELAPSDVLPGAHLSEPQALLDWKGLLTWLPWIDGKTGGRGAARFVDGTWKDLAADAGIPDKVLHLVPLNDGNLLILGVTDGPGVQLGMAILDRVQVDEKQIAALVESLADPDEIKRQAAYKRLTTYGSGIWPILEKMMNDQEPEAQARLRLLLKDKSEPTLGGLKLVGDKILRLAARLQDGGSVFYAEQGVIIPNPDPDADPSIVTPAWLSIRPGSPIELLPAGMVTDMKPAVSKIYAVGSDWIVNTDVRGPRRWVGNTLIQLLRKSEYAYSDFIGEDRRGRWLFRRPPSSATQPSTEPSGETNATLIIDPTLPDPTPRLPVWVFRAAKVVGWDKDNWPVARNVSSYALHADGWRLLDEKEKVFTTPQEIPGSPTTRAAATSPSTTSSTAPSTQSDEPPTPLLVDTDGNRYYDGLTELRVVTAKGEHIDWPLPPIANGQGPATLLRMRDGHLFLFNQRGRVLRLRPTPAAAEPFQLEATFTKNIPSLINPTRIWLDPAQRIVIADGSQLTFLFTSGYIPSAIAEKMTRDPDADE